MSRLSSAGPILEAGGSYYLDETTYAAYRSRRLRTTALVVAPLVVAAILVTGGRLRGWTGTEVRRWKA